MANHGNKENILLIVDEDDDATEFIFIEDKNYVDSHLYPLGIIQKDREYFCLSREEVKQLMLLCRRILKV